MTQDLRDTPWAGRYGVVYADPAWPFETWSAAGLGKSPEQHYRTTPLGEMGALPVGEVAAPDCWLFMWVTFPIVARGDHIELARLWSSPGRPWIGTTGGAWAKRPRNWRGDPDKWQFGTGYLFRSAAEVLLVYRRGNPAWVGKSERNLWTDPIREHSRKPDSVRGMIDRVCPGVPKLELFANDVAPGWDRWGDGHKRKGKRRG